MEKDNLRKLSFFWVLGTWERLCPSRWHSSSSCKIEPKRPEISHLSTEWDGGINKFNTFVDQALCDHLTYIKFSVFVKKNHKGKGLKNKEYNCVSTQIAFLLLLRLISVQLWFLWPTNNQSKTKNLRLDREDWRRLVSTATNGAREGQGSFAAVCGVASWAIVASTTG